MVVLVTGGSGQLGQSLQFIVNRYSEIQFVFFDSKDLDITNNEQVLRVFEQVRPNYCINAAAYTAVDKAETDSEKAYLVNVEGVINIANNCKIFKTKLLQISTDFVFDGEKTLPYTEFDIPNPKSIYGLTKLEGEKKIQEILDEYFIIRTSWVYSQFGSNFMNTMLRLSKERDSLNIVNDQIGTPTNAIDLGEVLIKIIVETENSRELNRYGIYNFSNEGSCSWFEFAKKIFETYTIPIQLYPITTADYPTAAKRPAYSVLSKDKIKESFGIEINYWDTRIDLK